MALSKNYTVQYHGKDVVFENCYIKVIEISATKDAAIATVHFLNTDDVVDRKQYDFVPELYGPNFIAQAYNHLKTLPEFAGATDC